MVLGIIAFVGVCVIVPFVVRHGQSQQVHNPSTRQESIDNLTDWVRIDRRSILEIVRELRK